MSNNKIIESPIFLGDAIRLLASKSTLGKDPRIAACKWIEEAQENANFAGQVRIFDSGGRVSLSVFWPKICEPPR